MKRVLVPSLLLFAILAAFAFACAQQDDSGLLTLDRIINSREFGTAFFGQVRWLADGSGFTSLEPSADKPDGRDIVRNDPATGEREILVSASKLVPATQSTPLDINDYEWSDDGGKLLIFTNSKRVWRGNTRGDYWVLDLAGGELKQLGGGAEESTLMFAKFSPQGDRVGYVRENNIYVENLADGKITALTSNGTKTLINGTFDWVYEEEFGLRDGFRWSPDGTKIAYWQLDASGIPDFHMIDNVDELYPTIITFQYPKVGQTNSSCRVGVVDASGGETTWIKLEGDPRMHYIAWMEWADNSEEIIFQRLNRLQNTIWLMLGNAGSGEAKTILTETDEAWVEVVHDFKWLDGGSRFTWVSERDGWRHVYVVSRSGEDVKLVTPGEFDVTSIETIDAEGGWIYGMASPDNPTQRFLYRIPLDGSSEGERLTPAEMTGSHRYQMSGDGKWAIHSWSSFDEPNKTELVELPAHKTVRTLVDNEKVCAALNAIKRSPVEFFRVDIGDGVELDAWCIKPHNFDPSKKYPLLVHVYGEPAGQTVVDRWGGRNYLWHTMLAQQGCVVMSFDNRGTPAPRGRDWRKIVYRQIGILAPQDQAAAVKAVLAERPYLDPERVGIWGWSGGGSMTLNAMFRYPEIYKTGIAVAFVANQRFYDSIYQERYMGLPEDNEEGFSDGSPVTHANKLEGNLLIIHGTGDDNVHYQNFEVLVNELIKHNKQFTMMSYPMRSHGIFEREGTTLHLFTLMTNYLEENLLK